MSNVVRWRQTWHHIAIENGYRNPRRTLCGSDVPIETAIFAADGVLAYGLYPTCKKCQNRFKEPRDE